MKYTKLKISLLVIFPLFFFASCKTYDYFNIEILEPAELILPQEMDTLLLTHRIYPTEGDTLYGSYKIFDNIFHDTVFIDSTLARNALSELAQSLHFSGRFVTKTVDTMRRRFPVSAAHFTEEDVNYLKKLCESAHADIIVMLNNWNATSSFDIFDDESGVYFGLFEVETASEWLLIDPFRSKLIDKHQQKDTLYYEVAPHGIQTDSAWNNARLQVMAIAARETGKKYADHLSPHYVQSSRLVFNKGDRNLKKGYAQAVEGNWKNAAYFWRKALASPEPKIKAMASFNLALASEMEGLLVPALEWAKESYGYFPDKLNTTYISILQKRIRQQEDIILQMKD